MSWRFGQTYICVHCVEICRACSTNVTGSVQECAVGAHVQETERFSVGDEEVCLEVRDSSEQSNGCGVRGVHDMGQIHVSEASPA